jgi:hypothetical protein
MLRIELARPSTVCRRSREMSPQACSRSREWTPQELEATLSIAVSVRYSDTRMVALQEELDWLTYSSYQLIDPIPSRRCTKH